MDIKEVFNLASADLFIPELEATNKQDALLEMVDKLIDSDYQISNRETVLQTLLSREQLGSTAIGPGVAFPHGRVLATQDLIIVIARSTKGIDFDSTDGKPTHLIFMLIAPPQDGGNQYIGALAALVEKMQEESLRDAFLNADDFDGAFKALTGED
jgi:nitrogen PTS system EIIA component